MALMSILKLDRPTSDMGTDQANLCRHSIATILFMENDFPPGLNT
jgi:hypothetical protein